MQIDILTLFPKMFDGPFSESIVKRAREKRIVEINIHDLRNWAKDKHKTVDDSPYGGGAGMVMRVDIVDAAISSIKNKISKIKNKDIKTILLTPQGKVFNQKLSQSFSQIKNLILVCGHYEGVDDRIREYLVDEEISIGDYVLTGGELPAMVLTDSIIRLIPGVLGKEESFKNESFSTISHAAKPVSLLKYPQYTRPEEYKGWKVPKTLLSGNHAEIEKWRQKKALGRTKSRRPDLLR